MSYWQSIPRSICRYTKQQANLCISTLKYNTFTEWISFECWKLILVLHHFISQLAWKTCATFPSNQEYLDKTKTNHDLFTNVFLSFTSASYNSNFNGWKDCLCPLWLVRVITLVLVFWHSIENHSTTVIYFIFYCYYYYYLIFNLFLITLYILAKF